MKLKPLFAAGALAAAALFGASAPGVRAVLRRRHPHRHHHRHVQRVRRHRRPGGVEAIRMAIADMGGTINGKKVEVVSADHQNKPDVAASKAREWFDTQGVDMLIGGTNSGTNLAMAKVAAEKKKPFISIGAGHLRLTNDQCTPYTLHWAYDTTALAKGTARRWSSRAASPGTS
jgi:branched-chain amino acid transport system substrate-binding protein